MRGLLPGGLFVSGGIRGEWGKGGWLTLFRLESSLEGDFQSMRALKRAWMVWKRAYHQILPIVMCKVNLTKVFHQLTCILRIRSQ